MSGDTILPAARVWTQSGFIKGPWQRMDHADFANSRDGFIYPLVRFLELHSAEREEVIGRIGVEILPEEAIAPLVSHLDRLPLIALAFPAFNDGRNYSKAELLRSRYGFTGDLRAVGDVLIDQIPHMLRCGLSSFEVTNSVTLQRLEAGRLGAIPLHYQPSSTTDARAAKYSWRRTPAQTHTI